MINEGETRRESLFTSSMSFSRASIACVKSYS